MGNKNSIIALGIIGVLFLVFALYSTKEQEKYQAELAAYNARQSEMELKTQSAQAATTSFESESKKLSEAKAAADVETFGSALIAARGEKSSVVTMANDLMSVTIDPRGAQIVGVELKEYTKYAPKGERTELIEMMERASAKMDLSFYIRNGLNNVKINTADYTFKSLPEQSVAGAKRRSFILEVGSGASIEYIYTLYSDESDARSYMMDFDIKLHSLSPMMASENVMLAWQNTSFQNEKGFTNENTYTTISYHIAGEGGADDLGVSTDNKSEQIVGEIEWIAFKQQFFSSIIIAKDNIKKADVSYTTAKPHSGYMKRFSAEMELPY
ncbi:MAG: membrane protein insertase YidC [Rikenellaceae bacterium]